MGKVIALIVYVAIIVALGAFIVMMIKTLFGFIVMHFRATKTLVTKPGADEAYEMLKQHAVNGKVSYKVMEQAASMMLSKGVSSEEVYNFIADCSLLINMDAAETRSCICRAEEKIRDLSCADAQLYMHLDSVKAAEASMDIERKKTELQRDIEDAKEHLKI